jgi:hypothetical protein
MGYRNEAYQYKLMLIGVIVMIKINDIANLIVVGILTLKNKSQ